LLVIPVYDHLNHLPVLTVLYETNDVDTVACPTAMAEKLIVLPVHGPMVPHVARLEALTDTGLISCWEKTLSKATVVELEGISIVFQDDGLAVFNSTSPRIKVYCEFFPLCLHSHGGIG